MRIDVCLIARLIGHTYVTKLITEILLLKFSSFFKICNSLNVKFVMWSLLLYLKKFDSK